MITDAQIQERLFAYLTRDISLNEFEDWLVQHSWNMHRDSSDVVQRLVGAIELRLAEYSNGHLTDAGLERELQGLFAPSVTVWIENARPTEPVVIGASASESQVIAIPFAQAA